MVVSVRMIKALRHEAVLTGDQQMVDICDLALAPFEMANADGSPLTGPDGAQWSRTDARNECARVIAEANAAEPGLWTEPKSVG